MPLYQYTIRDQTGSLRVGTSEADDIEFLVFRLQQQGFEVEDIQESYAPDRRSKVRVARNDVLLFWIQFSIMIDAKVARWRALDVAAERANSPMFAKVLVDIAGQVMGGTTLHKAMTYYPAVFDKAAIGIIHAGEVGNALPDAVHRLIQYMDRDRRRTERS